MRLTRTVCGLLAGLMASTAMADNPKVLMFTKSSGFQHSVVTRGKNGELGLAEKTVVDLGKKLGFDVTVSKDGAMLSADNLKKFDAVVFYTQGDLTQSGVDKQPPVAMEDRPAILDYVKQGGGFVGLHSGGADTYHGWKEGKHKPFLEMVGGEFSGHGDQEPAIIEVVDPTFPAIQPFHNTPEIMEEWYSYHDFQPNIHVLAILKTDTMDRQKNANNIAMYKRPAYPIAWCSQHGKGKLFYNGMGHREDVWENPKYQDMAGQAILWALGKVKGDASPNLKALYGSEKAGLERINPPKK